MIQRQGDGFQLDASRVAYLRFLRRERQQSPRSEANADFQRAKAELIRMRIAEKKRELIPQEEAFGQMEELVGLFFTRLSGLAARPALSQKATTSPQTLARHRRSWLTTSRIWADISQRPLKRWVASKAPYKGKSAPRSLGAPLRRYILLGHPQSAALCPSPRSYENNRSVALSSRLSEPPVSFR